MAGPSTWKLLKQTVAEWIEDGVPAYAVDELTIAGNLRAMFEGIEAVGSEVDPRSHIRTGPILVGRMTVAGGDA